MATCRLPHPHYGYANPERDRRLQGVHAVFQHVDAEKWWSDSSLAEMNFDWNMNPYDVDDDHPAAKLQMTKRATLDWIHARRIDPTMKGIHLSKV